MKKMSIGIILLLLGNLANAEGGCPAGMIPHSGTDISACGPIPPGYNKPSGHWETRWGSYVLSEDEGITGWSLNELNADTANESAISNCISKGGTQCKVVITYQNSCIAVAASDGGGYAYTDQTRDMASSKAMNSCERAGEKNCRLFRIECSPAKWISD